MSEAERHDPATETEAAAIAAQAIAATVRMAGNVRVQMESCTALYRAAKMYPKVAAESGGAAAVVAALRAH